MKRAEVFQNNQKQGSTMATKKTAPKKTTRKKKAVADKPEQPIIEHGFKGFTKDFTCTGGNAPFQYEVGKTYEEAEASLCHKGFHYCEYPLDCFDYYRPGDGSRYSTVEAANPSDERKGDSKRVTKKLTIGGELTFRGIIEAAVKFTFDRATWNDSDKATAEREAASATGDYGAASATGGKGAASATGGKGAASATGDYGAASATGFQGAASATGGKGAASATGDYGAASATGDYGAASATGKESVAMACGRYGKAKACLGSWIVLAERNDDWEIITMRCAVIDGEILKPDTYYTLKNGEFIEAKE
jgi:hypothetical protein